MKIDAISVTLPARHLTNDDVVALVAEHSRAVFRGNLARALSRIRHLLRYSGARQRHWSGPDERPVDLVAQAFGRAVQAAGCQPRDIDLVIYAGVDRGFVEPANAHLVAQALGLARAQCFDLLDACNSWSRALQVSYGLLRAGLYRRIAIVNGEFNMFAGGPIYPALFCLETAEALEWRFPAFTLGEAATATILSPAPERGWEFCGAARTDLADLCTVPLPGWERYCRASARIGRDGHSRFASFGRELFLHAAAEVARVFRRLAVPRGEIRAIFPHAATRRAWQDGARRLGVEHLVYDVYARCGNLVSASVPAAMALAVEEGRLGRGDRVVGLVASAGMSFSAYSFVY